MKILVADIGNTRAKIAIYDGTQPLTDIQTAEHSQMNKVAIDMCQQHSVVGGMLSSVAADSINTSFIEALSEAHVVVHRLDATLKLPFSIAYETPQTLGSDRIAAVAGAVSEFVNANILIIDAGTAITYEYVSANNVYLGGNISPGIAMRFRALNAFTGKLPISDATCYTQQIGSTTKNAIAAGVMRGVNYEVEGVIEDFLQKNATKNIVILTGGDYKGFVLKVKSCIFARPNLVMDGIANIYMANFGTLIDCQRSTAHIHSHSE